MRRGIGVGHLQQQRQTQQQMSQLGAQITAERVGQIADQLESLEQQLRALAAKHKDDIKQDPLVRARFRQLADSLGVDLISSKKNVFAGVLGLGDFYYSLASKVVEVCMKERKFCGSYVPLAKVTQELQRQYDAQTTAAAAVREAEGKQVKRTTVTDEDVNVSLKKLACLGAGYNVVTLAGTRYIQTTPDGASGSDEVPLLNFVIEKQKEQIRDAKAAALSSVSAQRASTTTPAPSHPSTARDGSHPPLLGAAFVLGPHPLVAPEDVAAIEAIPLAAQCVSLRQRDLAVGLGWPAHRVHAAVERMVQGGSVWIDYPTDPALPGKAGAVLSATESSNLADGSARKRHGLAAHGDEVQSNENALYWFISLTSSAEVTI